MSYQTFSDLVNDLESKFLDANGSMEGNITGENAEKLASFYSYWSNYLEPTPAFLSFLAYIPGGIAKALYQITASLEHVFNNMFKLFGLFGYLGDSTSVIGQFYYWFQVLGVTLFALVLVVSALTGVFTKPVKYKSVITNFLMVAFVTSVLPLGLTTISQVIAEDAMNVQTLSSTDEEGETTQYSSLAIQPLKNNVVDLKVLIDNDFSTELFPLDDYGYIQPPDEGSTPVNNITDSTDQRDTADFVTRIDFGATYGATNSGELMAMDEKLPGIRGLFLHKLNSNQDGVVTITEHTIVDGLNAFESVYMRYKVNWIGMFMQYIILIVLLISMSIKFVKSVFDILIQAVISPLQGLSSTRSKKYKELLKTIGGALAGIFFEVVIMRITLEVCRDLPTLAVSGITKLSGGFFTGLNMWEQVIAASLVYIGLFLAAMQGVSMVERWLGVSTGHSETAQQLLGAMMMGQAFASGAGGVLQGGLGVAGLAGNVAGSVGNASADIRNRFGNSLANKDGGIRDPFKASEPTEPPFTGVRDPTAKKPVENSGGVDSPYGASGSGYAGADEPPLGAAGYASSPTSGDADAPVLSEESGYNGSGAILTEDPESGVPTGGGITDPTIPPVEPQGQAFTGVTDPTATPKKTSSQPRFDPQNRFQQSKSHLQAMKQEMQQGSQYMQGRSHITGAEIDESDE